MAEDDTYIYQVIGDGVILAVVGCRQCGHIWLAQAYVTTLRALECPTCHREASMALDAFPTLQACLRAYAGVPRVRATH